MNNPRFLTLLLGVVMYFCAYIWWQPLVSYANQTTGLPEIINVLLIIALLILMTFLLIGIWLGNPLGFFAALFEFTSEFKPEVDSKTWKILGIVLVAIIVVIVVFNYALPTVSQLITPSAQTATEIAPTITVYRTIVVTDSITPTDPNAVLQLALQGCPSGQFVNITVNANSWQVPCP